MKYTLDCGMLDGLVFIDESYLAELNDADLLYAMDILLDSSGTSELICDFPNEDWDIVRQREALRFPYHRAVFHRYPELYQHHERQYSEPEEGICFRGGSGRNQTAGTRDDCMGGVLVLCVNDDLGTDC